MTANARTQIILADDHPLVLRGVQSLLEAERDLEITRACQDGEAALAAIRKCTPTLAILDLSMPKLTGLDVLTALRCEGSATRVILLSASMLDEHIYKAVSLGVNGIVLKDSAPDTLVHCVREVLAGRRWYAAEVVEEAVRRETGRRSAGSAIADQLTSREREIVGLLTRGSSNKDVARLLNISDGTVKIHLHNVYQKLGVTSRSKLIEIAERFKDQLEKG